MHSSLSTFSLSSGRDGTVDSSTMNTKNRQPPKHAGGISTTRAFPFYRYCDESWQPRHTTVTYYGVNTINDILNRDPMVLRTMDNRGLYPLNRFLSCAFEVKDAMPTVMSDIFNIIMNVDPKVAELRDSYGRTPLHWAVRRGANHDTIVRLVHMCTPMRCLFRTTKVIPRCTR